MSNRFFAYLEREHARLETLVAEQLRRPMPDTIEIAKLKKQKLMVKDQIDRWQADARASQTA
ncbi:hypothetical protein WP12_08220 [Sphingomonas sp. SRS2]|nr:hypothetical protein WP12_08220 [Sphingomonas sp. SRS2]